MRTQALDIDNLPTQKDEAWKYTPVARAVPKDLRKEVNSPAHVIHSTCGKAGGEVEDILFTGVNNTLHTPTLKITVEDNAQLELVERHTGEGQYWKNMAVEVTLGKNAHFHHYRLIEDTAEALTTINTNVHLSADSSYHAYAFVSGAGTLRNETRAVLAGQGAHCDLAGVNLLDGKRHADTTILIEHQAPHCTSSQFFRHVLADQSRGVFQGKVHVHQIAQKTDGYQLSNALLLSDKAEMDTKPELEIYADDVKCSHGSTIGQLDDEPLFYLRTRGLSEAEARMLLIEAFLDEVSEKIKDEGMRARVQGMSRKWLAKIL